MLVHWTYLASLESITVYPSKDALIATKVFSWSVRSNEGNVRGLVSSAKGSLTIYPSNTARNILSNMLEKGAVLLNSLKSDKDFCFANYWFDPSAQDQGSCGLVLGLEDESFESIKQELKFSYSNGMQIAVRGTSGISDVENNPYSASPTWEKFEVGLPAAVSDFSISIIPQVSLNSSHGSKND